MRLFHVSEEGTIRRFEPRIPVREELGQRTGLVWAIDEARLCNFLTPRSCPRVTYHTRDNTTREDRRRFFSSDTAQRAVVIESRWLGAMRDITLYLYEFDPADFVLQDAVAGYYVAKTPQVPVAVRRVDDLLGELVKRNVEIRVVDSLWDLAEQVRQSTLNWSLCKMANAQPRKPA